MQSTTYKRLSVVGLLASSFATLVTATPTPSKNIKTRFQPGSCSLHLIQYQKARAVPGVDPYQVQVNIFDAVKTEIGSSGVVPTNPTADIDSQLPFVLIITAGNLDSDPLGYQYAGQAWTSDDSQCSTGKYSGGSRQMDCSFTC